MPALLTLRWLTGAGRHGSLRLQDLIRDLKTDDLDQQNLCVGAGRCAGPCRTSQSLCMLDSADDTILGRLGAPYTQVEPAGAPPHKTSELGT